MADFVERLRRAAHRPSDLQLAAILFAGLTLVMAWTWFGKGAPDAAASVDEQSVTIARRPFTASLSFAGTIVPGDAVGVTAPFDGSVTALGFTYGDRVQAGQMIAELDADELLQTRNEAEGTYLKAAQSAEEMTAWTNGPEMSRARRAASSALLELNAAERAFRETERLLDRGLVPRNEYDSATQRLQTQRMAVASANEELAATTRRGQGANRRMAAIELDTARARLGRLDGQLRRAVVRAPDTGVIVRPPAGLTEATGGVVHIGARMNRGQLIGTIARAGGLSVAFTLDEGDINTLKLDQRVTVTGPGFASAALTGKIVSIAGEAIPDGPTSAGKSRFTATARLDSLTAEQAALVRIGMSAAIVVTTYSNPAAFVVPPQAVQGAAPATTVLVRRTGSADPQPVPVRIGNIAPDGVEITSGLKTGDVVVWTPPPPADAPPAGK